MSMLIASIMNCFTGLGACFIAKVASKLPRLDPPSKIDIAIAYSVVVVLFVAVSIAAFRSSKRSHLD